MRRNQVRNHVSDSVEYGFDRLHRIADRCLVYPLAAVEGAIEGAARGVHNMVTHKHYHLDRATGADPGKCKCKSKPPSGSAFGQPVGPGPYAYYGYPPPLAPPPPAAPLPPPAAPQFQYNPAFPVPCRPPY